MQSNMLFNKYIFFFFIEHNKRRFIFDNVYRVSNIKYETL